MSAKEINKKENIATANTKNVIEYYNNCWLNRFSEGHNSASYAMHFGVFKDGDIDNDEAKLETNKFIASFIGLELDVSFKVADFGCGVGGTSVYLAENFPLSSVVGVNISKEQISFAKGFAKNLPNLSFVVNDYTKTHLLSDALDYVIAIESIWHAFEKMDVYSEAYRVLKKGGSFSFIDYFQLTKPENEENKKLVADFNNGWGAYVDGTGPIKLYECDYINELKNIGFHSVKSESMLSDVYKGIERSYTKAQKQLAVNGLSEGLFRHYKACTALKLLIDRGVIDYRITKGVK